MLIARFPMPLFHPSLVPLGIDTDRVTIMLCVWSVALMAGA